MTTQVMADGETMPLVLISTFMITVGVGVPVLDHLGYGMDMAGEVMAGAGIDGIVGIAGTTGAGEAAGAGILAGAGTTGAGEAMVGQVLGAHRTDTIMDSTTLVMAEISL